MAKYWTKQFKNIFFTGLPAAGKTSFGKEYAHFSDRHFVDFEHYIESYKHKTIAELVLEHGMEGFRNIEFAMLERLERYQNHVIALGSGTLSSLEQIYFARRVGLIVWVHTPIPTLTKRILEEQANPKSGRVRPLFSDLHTAEKVTAQLEELLEENRKYYEQADTILNTEFSSYDNLKLQLSLVEKRASNRNYMADVRTIMREKNP